MKRETERFDRRLIEAGFPFHQVGAETQRERGASSALPPLYFLHVWWGRRPLTPSRAAILSSLLPADTDPDWFLRQLGIEKVQAMVGEVPWTLDDVISESLQVGPDGQEWLRVSPSVMRALSREKHSRSKQRDIIEKFITTNPAMTYETSVQHWVQLSQPMPEPMPQLNDKLEVRRVSGEPAWFAELMEIASSLGNRVPNLYGYKRAYQKTPDLPTNSSIMLDPTAGGGSIPFEALRLGHSTIANDLNPVAAVILKATVDYPLRFGVDLVQDIEDWGRRLLNEAHRLLEDAFTTKPYHTVTLGQPMGKLSVLKKAITESTRSYLFARQVTCPHCGGEVPLLNTCWLSKTGNKWAVSLIPDGSRRNGKVRFETYRVTNGKGPNGEDPDFNTVQDGDGRCIHIHCGQSISSDEIKKQARGESPHGIWRDRLYCVVAIREQPKLDSKGQPIRFKSGARAGEIRTEKIVFYRPPNEVDQKALENGERMLKERWDEWDRQGLIPTERFPKGNDMRPVIYGMTRWCDMFTPRQLLGHLILIDELNKLKPGIMKLLGTERGRAVVTYLQFAIDKNLDYNSKQTRWEYTRGIVKGTFGRHDYSTKWTFGEMIFVGPNSGAAWALSQVVDAYKGIAELLAPVRERLGGVTPPVEVTCGTAANMDVESESVDLICIDPPYYDNVQYGELSDYFYVWQRRTLGDLYPDWFRRRLTDKIDEAVANPVRDGSKKNAASEYNRLMTEIFAECRRVLKPDGIMIVMFTHKSTAAWEALMRSLIDTGWVITSSAPIESEATQSMHQKGKASAASSILLSCRKRSHEERLPTVWLGVDGSGVLQQVKEAVRDGLVELESLKLNPVDEMVASYGRALKVLSEAWPVMDGDDLVSPVKAMKEASLIVNQYQISRLTNGRIRIGDLDPESAMALTAYGVFGLTWFDYDEALNMSRSLGTSLVQTPHNYELGNLRIVGIAAEKKGRALKVGIEEELGYYAPFVRKGSKLRLARPEERNRNRLGKPLTMWDILHGLIISYRKGDIPVARAYLDANAPGSGSVIIDTLRVWTSKASDKNLRKEAKAILFGLAQVEG
jgi:putative DNA methylase